MPIHTSWPQEPYIRLLRYEGIVTTEDIEAMLLQEVPLYDNLQNKVYTILDLHHLKRFQVNPLKISGLMKIMKHPNLGYFIMAGNNPIGNFWTQTLSKMMGVAPMYNTKSLEDALEFARSLTQVGNT